MAFSRS